MIVLKVNKILLAVIILIFITTHVNGSNDPSVARLWNELLLEAIRNDYARPTIHARNLFHVSAAMYDAWAAFDQTADNYYIPKYQDIINSVANDDEKKAAQEEALSYAVYRLIKYRFRSSPAAVKILPLCDSLFIELGLDTQNTSVDFSNGSPAALGNYIAKTIIDFGQTDGSNEQNNYNNKYYQPVNLPLDPTLPGSPDLFDPNRWQPLTLGTFIDQSGHEIPISTPKFLGAEWGMVKPFALKEEDLKIHSRDGFDYWVYHDPGPPPYIDTTNIGGVSEHYKWGFVLVSIWSSHLAPDKEKLIDISPASIGNIPHLPESIEDYNKFYDLIYGGDTSEGYPVNPATGQAYRPQIVPLGDYARVLAEFWADGPNSETPPGHWFTILNYVSDHPDFEKRFKGEGIVLDDLEWDVKAYFVLGGAMHDAAIASWSVKGWYDYIRPISAIRSMAQRGQSSDANLPNYHPGGIPLVEGFIELVEPNDELAGELLENVGKIKIYSWKGHYYIPDPITENAGVGWILAEDWWPYQRPTFVTPPFAGYVSGHSTFSRAAAEVLTLLTGDEFFPGGMGEFFCKQNEFLVFENGPSMDVTLQWATYRDASDQCSLSRIWGGIHPPTDDIPGRKMGIEIGVSAFDYSEKYFTGQITNPPINRSGPPTEVALSHNYPNPFNSSTTIPYSLPKNEYVQIHIFDALGRGVRTLVNSVQIEGNHQVSWNGLDNTGSPVASGVYFYQMTAEGFTETRKLLILR